MKCQKCDEQATHHVTELVSGKPEEYHVCDKHLQTLESVGPGTAPEREANRFEKIWNDLELGKAMQDSEATDKMAAYLLPALCLALLDPRPEVRIKSALHLTTFRRTANTAIQALRNALLDEDERVRGAAEIAIEFIESDRSLCLFVDPKGHLCLFPPR